MKTFLRLLLAAYFLIQTGAPLFAEPAPASPGTLSEEQWVMLVYQKGKESYDRGDYEGASAEWDKLEGVSGRYPAFKMVIDYLRGRTKELSAEDADRVEQQLSARQKEINAAFQSGKELYDQGRVSEALAEWDKLSRFLPEDAPQRRPIEDLRRYYIQSQKKPEPREMSAEESAQMTRFFASAAELFKTQAQQAGTALEAAGDAQKTVDDAYSKAKLLYYQGNYAGAMKEIEKLAPYFPEGSQERKSIDSLTRVYAQSLDEKDSAERLLAQRSTKAKLPSDFNSFSAEVDEKFRAELKEAEARRSGSERTLEDRQAWSAGDFHKGAELYRAGDAAGAVRQWEAVAPDFENERTVRALIETVKKNQAELARLKAEAEEALAEKQALINSRLEKGRLFYEAGNFDEAKREWNSIKGLVDDDSKIDAFVSQMQSVYQDSQKVKKAEDEAAAAASARLKTPEALSTTLSWAQDKLKSRAAEAETSRARSEKAAAEREALLSKTVSSGKALAEAGKFPEALKEWKGLLTIVQDEQGLARTLDALESDHAAALKMEEAAREAEAKSSAKAEPSGDLSSLLSETGRQLRAQHDSASSRRRQAEQTLVDRQSFVTEHFQNGKNAFDAGRFSEALKEWSQLLPHLEDEAKLRPLIDQAAAAQKALEAEQSAASEAESRKDKKLKAPGDLTGLLASASAKLSAEASSAKLRAEAADKTYSQREQLVRNTFEKGKADFDAGRYSDAVRQWEAILGDLQEGEALRASMKEIEGLYEDSIAAQKAAEASTMKSGAKLQAPAAMTGLLIELKQKLQAQTQAQHERKGKAEAALSERQAKLDASVAKGKLAVEEGRIDEALAEWTALLPELQEEQRLREMMDAIRAEQQTLSGATEEASSSETRQAGRIPAPPELERTLSDFFIKLKGETSVAQGRRQKYDEDFENRKIQVQNTYQKGVALFDEGKYQEALAEWTGILPQLEDQAKLQQMIDQANEDFENLAVAQKAVFDADARGTQRMKAPGGLAQHMKAAIDKIKQQSLDEMSAILDEEIQASGVDRQTLAMKAKKFKAPSDISNELADTRLKMKDRLSGAEVERQQAERELGERQAKLEAEFEKGKKLYWDGRLTDAIQVWASIAPQLEDEDMQRQILAIAQDYDNLLAAQKQTQEAELKTGNKLKTPEGMPKMLDDVKQIIQSQTQYADTQKKIADQTYVDRQALINSTFQKGKNLYEQDRIPEALDEWASIAPYLEKGSQLKEFIDGVAKNHQDSLLARQAAEEAQIKKSIKFKTPPDLSRYLEDAAKKMKAQAEDSQMQKEAADRSRRERQIWVDGKFERGKVLYNQGDVAAAVEEWKAILPYIEDDSKVRALIVKAEENRRQLEAGQTASAAAAPPAKVVVPPDLGKAVAAANVELEKSIEKQNQRKLEADVLEVIQEKKKQRSSAESKPRKPATPAKVPLDEIEQMMLEYNIATPAELEKRHQEIKAIQ